MLMKLATAPTNRAKRRLYVAYGSNMNLEQMALRCPTATVVGTAVLRNWRLLFQGVATIERFKGGEAPVLVWDIKTEDEDALDRYEGWPRLYRKESVRVRIDGKQVRAMVYIMNGARHLYEPSRSYFNTIRDGYVSAGLDLTPLYEALALSHSNAGGTATSKTAITAKTATRAKIWKKGQTTMNETIKEQILAIRDSGATNMFDTTTVQRIAFEMEFHELVNFIESDRKAYARFILTGKTFASDESTEG